MALPASGQLTTAEIYEEVYQTTHTTQEISLYAMAIEAGFSTSNLSTATFYGYSACSETIPSALNCTASWVMNARISISFTKLASHDGIDAQQSSDTSTWIPLYSSYTGASPLNTTTSCAYTYFRLRAYNCAGYGNYGSWSNAGSCPP